MRKLINGQYVRVEASDPVKTEVKAEKVELDNFAEVLEQSDLDAMNEGQLIGFLRGQGIPANARWKAETLRAKSAALLEVIKAEA